MRAFLTRALIVASSLLIAATVSAQATQGLERVGPTSPTNGYPTWYQDKTGITLEFCTPQNAVELSGGWCLLLPADTTAPETFPTPFSEEHFYWAAGATLAANLGATLTLGLEGAFANGPVINGDQITFARVRFKFRAPVAGQYTVYHPYGTKVVTAAAGELVFITEDVGLTCPPGTFDCALRGAIGPFLLASNTPGGPELEPVAGPVPGALYIADPARIGPVTGSPVNQNFFRITGPAIDVSTNDFSLMGRLYTANLGGRVTVDRASYSRDAGQVNGKLDVFATAFATAQPRVPGGAITGASVPALGFFPTACTVGAGGALGSPGGAPVQMFGADTRYYGQVTGAIPTAVCVQDVTARDANGQIVPSYTQKTVTDMVTISQALYNPASGGSLTVAAVSSDANIPPTLTVSGFGSFTSGASLSLLVGVPPSKVLVTSANGGFAEIEVSTNPGQPQLPQAPFAASDAFIIAEDSGANSLNVLANDTFGGAAVVAANTTINIVQQGALGIATVANGAIVFTPALNKFGSDLLQVLDHGHRQRHHVAGHVRADYDQQRERRAGCRERHRAGRGQSRHLRQSARERQRSGWCGGSGRREHPDGVAGRGLHARGWHVELHRGGRDIHVHLPGERRLGRVVERGDRHGDFVGSRDAGHHEGRLHREQAPVARRRDEQPLQ